MKQKLFNLDQSITWLKQSNILIHPSESIWGIGCDAENEKSIDKIYKLKKRAKNKKFILLSYSIEKALFFADNINDDKLNFISSKWPGPNTLLIKYNNKLPSHLKNETGKIAIRVSDYYHLNALGAGYKNFMISTSANISGKKAIANPIDILKTFDDPSIAYYDAPLGGNLKPSNIIDLETRKIIR